MAARVRSFLSGRPKTSDAPAPALEFRRPDFDQLSVLRSLAEFHTAVADIAPRLAFERALVAGHEGDDHWRVTGYCLACDTPVQFSVDWAASGRGVPNWRERLVCPGCDLNNRQRFVAHRVKELGAQDVYLHEQITAFWLWAERRLPGAVGSEYLGPDIPSGTVIEGVRHEDALALSFDDAAFDLIVSNDVFEHVPEIEPALAEAARVLRPGGQMIFSVPFYNDRQVTTQRARFENGELVELAPPEYHGNPVDPEQGSLVFYDYGWDLLDRCRAAGFSDAYVTAYWSGLYGHIGNGVQLVFEAVR